MHCEVANKYDDMVILFMPPLNNGKIVLLLSLLMEAMRPLLNKVFISKRPTGGWVDHRSTGGGVDLSQSMSVS